MGTSAHAQDGKQSLSIPPQTQQQLQNTDGENNDRTGLSSSSGDDAVPGAPPAPGAARQHPREQQPRAPWSKQPPAPAPRSRGSPVLTSAHRKAWCLHGSQGVISRKCYKQRVNTRLNTKRYRLFIGTGLTSA